MNPYAQFFQIASVDFICYRGFTCELSKSRMKNHSDNNLFVIIVVIMQITLILFCS